MKSTIKKLYSFIAKLVILLEDELNELQSNKVKNAISAKKNITDILNKLVSLITQLNKLNKDEELNSNKTMLTEDQKIIKRFLEKYK